MIRENAIDRLTMALVLNSELKAVFISHPEQRIEAITEYNKNCREFHGGRRIDLNEEEMQLILALQAVDIQQYITKLADVLETLKTNISSSSKGGLVVKSLSTNIVAA